MAVVLGCLIVLPLGNGLLTARADQGIDDQVEQAGEAVDEANAAVKKALGVLKQTEAQLPKARAARQSALNRAAQARAQALAAGQAADQARAQLAATQASLEQINVRLAEAAERVDDVARTAYQQGPLSQIEVLLSSADPQDFAVRMTAVDRMVRSQAQAQQELFAAKAQLAQQEVKVGALTRELEQQEKAANQQLAKAEEASRDAAAAEAEVAQLVKQRAKALRKARANRVAVAQRYAKLKRVQARMQRQAREAARREAARRASQDDGVQLDESVLGMVWPVSGGGISDRPGPRTHPVYGYASCHTGIDITGGSGTPIKAARDGTVAAITHGGPYGTATLIAHGDGMTTFYAHQSSVRVKEGDHVQAGEVIGEIGSTGWVTGPHLHFEIRLNGDAYDPMGWYGKAKDRVGCQ